MCCRLQLMLNKLGNINNLISLYQNRSIRTYVGLVCLLFLLCICSLTGLSSMMLIWAARARIMWRAHLHNRIPWQRLEPQAFPPLSKHPIYLYYWARLTKYGETSLILWWIYKHDIVYHTAWWTCTAIVHWRKAIGRAFCFYTPYILTFIRAAYTCWIHDRFIMSL